MPTTGSLRMPPNGRVESQPQHEAGFYFTPKGRGIRFNFDLNHDMTCRGLGSLKCCRSDGFKP
jgi:hypothetical protein